MQESAISNGHRPGATERLVPAPAAPLVESAPVSTGAKHRERQIWTAVFHAWVVGASAVTVVLVLGFILGLAYAR